MVIFIVVHVHLSMVLTAEHISFCQCRNKQVDAAEYDDVLTTKDNVVVEELVNDQDKQDKIVKKGKRIKTKGLETKFKEKSSSDVLSADIGEAEIEDLPTALDAMKSNQINGQTVKPNIEEPIELVNKSEQKTETSKSIKKKVAKKEAINENQILEQEDKLEKQGEEIKKETLDSKELDVSDVDASPKEKITKKKIIKKTPKQAHIADEKIPEDGTKEIIPDAIENNIQPDNKQSEDTTLDSKKVTVSEKMVSMSKKGISDTEKENSFEEPMEMEESVSSSSSEFSSSSYSSNDESVTDKMAKVDIKDKKVKSLKKKRARRDTEKLIDDQVDESSEIDQKDKPASPEELSPNEQDVLLVLETMEEKVDSVEAKKAKSTLSVEEKMLAQKGKKKGEHKEAVFEKPKLKKAERVQRDLPKQELEEVDLKKHKFEKLALHEMVTEYLIKYY